MHICHLTRPGAAIRCPLLPCGLVLLLLGLFGPLDARAIAPPSDTLRSDTTTSTFDPEAGRFLQRFLDPDTYGATRQNWDAVQDSSGRLYVANTKGVVLYNGHGWRTVEMPNQSAAVSLAADERGRVFVGGKGDFGRIRTDSVGRKQYVSLGRHVPKRHQPIGEISRTAATDEGIYFQSSKRIFRWTPETNKIRVWQLSGAEFQHASAVRDTLFVNVAGEGLMAIRGDSLRLVPGGEELADRSVRFLLPHGEHGLLVGAFRGLLRRQGRSFRPFTTGADTVLRKAWLYAGTRLHDGTIAIGTIDHGLLLLAPDGTVRRHLHPRGHPVTGLHEDREGGLWALLDGGMVRYDIGSPFTAYGGTTRLSGIVLDLARHHGTLYAGTTKAPYRLQTAPDTLASFRRLPNVQRMTTDTPSWCLLSTEEDLLIGTALGLARRTPEGTIDYLFRETQVYDLIRSRVDSARIYAATENGIRLLNRESNGWTDEGRVFTSQFGARMMAQGTDGTLWVGMSQNSLLRLRGLASSDSVTAKHFGPDDGLPKGSVGPHRWQGEVVFGTASGIFQHDAGSNPAFSPHPALEQPPRGDGGNRVHVQTDQRGRTWGYTMVGPGRWNRNGSTWQWRPGALHRLRGTRIRTLEIEDGGRTVWFGTWDGRMLRYVPDSGWPRASVPTLIHQVRDYSTDSVLVAQAAGHRPRSEGGVQITYGAPSLARPSAIRYQYKMVGRDDEWSDWTARTNQTYRNLGPGLYTFAVRARLAYGDTTETARYAFTVLPPWYRTWWAYGLYMIGAIVLVAGIVQWRTRQLRRRQEQLETAVAERTAEIEKQKEQLTEQAERLQELDEAKTRFFANVSHEFRTPLTLILGPVEDLRERIRPHLSNEDLAHLNVIERNAQRLLRLVDQILDIARMDAGTYRLEAAPTDVPAEIDRIVHTFEPLAERSGLTLSVDHSPEYTDQEAAPVYTDGEALEHIVGNLLSNAVKFSPSGGTITVTTRETPEAVEVAVTDTGPGIPEAEQAAIFERFQQSHGASGSSARSQKGAGIGLAFVQNLVDLHGGAIEIDSAEGVGTTVTVRFPRGHSHLAEDHLADTASGADGPNAPAPSWTPHPDPPDLPDATEGDDESQKRQILVVEDNADVRRYVRSILGPDFHVLGAVNGADGLCTAQKQLPDLILADVMMPEMGGQEMTRRLKEHPETKSIPIIMVTARAGTGDEVDGLKAGADDYITKPFDAAVLRQRVEGVFTLQERLRERLQAEQNRDVSPTSDEHHSRSEIEQQARDIIHEHLPDPDFDVSVLADELAMSRSTLYRAFRADAETTPSALITEVRMNRAAQLLRAGEGSVTQVAYAVGYEQLSSFSRAFQKYSGEPPSTLATAEPV